MSNICDAQGRRPLLLSPAFKDYIWGGNRLKRDWGKRTDMTPLAESWELSCHEAGPSVIAGGAYAGRTLGEYLAGHPEDAGAKAQNAGAFPLLIKLIDRETDQTSYELVKELRGGFRAFFWQSIARLFGANLKDTYDKEGEDMMVEELIRLYEAGLL